MTPSLQGMLTPEQKKARDLNQALFGDRYQIGQPNTRFASCAITAGHHVAMTATIVKGNANTSSTQLAQTGNGAMVAEQQNEKIEGSMQTDDEQEQAMIEKTIEKSGGDFESFKDKFVKSPEDTKIEGFINDSDISKFSIFKFSYKNNSFYLVYKIFATIISTLYF